MRTPSSRRASGALLAGALCALLTLPAVPALADAPTPSPSPSPSGAAVVEPATPTPTATPSVGGAAAATPAPTPVTAAPTTPTPSETATAIPTERPVRQAQSDDSSLTLGVAALGSPQPGHFFQDLGRFGFSGQATGIAEGNPVEIYRRTTTGTWLKVAATTVSSGAYATSLPVTFRGVLTFSATTGGAPGSGDEVASPAVSVRVADSGVSLKAPPARVDSLKKPILQGAVTPARPGVHIHLDVRSGRKYKVAATAVTDAAGRFRVSFGYGRAHLAPYTVRSVFHAANRNRWEVSRTRTVHRVAVLNAVAVDTTKADVADTYHKGCPVGRSRLQTISMNFYGRDKLMHRGLMIIRTDLVPEVTRSFGKALAARYPIAKMNNPNVYGGNDPRQMKANNTSGFNCRKVVGNPYAQSPHSYGIALDVNTVQNPYRDGHGKWWPSNGKKYRDRTPLKKGMLGKSSTLTKKLTSEGFFWGGRWSPGRDYQHFEYRP